MLDMKLDDKEICLRTSGSVDKSDIEDIWGDECVSSKERLKSQVFRIEGIDGIDEFVYIDFGDMKPLTDWNDIIKSFFIGIPSLSQTNLYIRGEKSEEVLSLLTDKTSLTEEERKSTYIFNLEEPLFSDMDYLDYSSESYIVDRDGFIMRIPYSQSDTIMVTDESSGNGEKEIREIVTGELEKIEENHNPELDQIAVGCKASTKIEENIPESWESYSHDNGTMYKIPGMGEVLIEDSQVKLSDTSCVVISEEGVDELEKTVREFQDEVGEELEEIERISTLKQND